MATSREELSPCPWWGHLCYPASEWTGPGRTASAEQGSHGTDEELERGRGNAVVHNRAVGPALGHRRERRAERAKRCGLEPRRTPGSLIPRRLRLHWHSTDPPLSPPGASMPTSSPWSRTGASRGCPPSATCGWTTTRSPRSLSGPSAICVPCRP